MNEEPGYLLGFDPGGKGKDNKSGNFGWSICRAEAGQFHLCETGRARYAEQAVEQVSDNLPPNPNVLAIGIDAPMFWHKTGHREIDGLLREEVERLGCPHPWGTVQSVNALWGACLVQGVLLVRELCKQQRFEAPITEANPKALRWLKPATFYYIQRLTEGEGKSDHERDATIAAYGGWAMHKDLYGWRDLFRDERDPYRIWEKQVSYWMPIREQLPG